MSNCDSMPVEIDGKVVLRPVSHIRVEGTIWVNVPRLNANETVMQTLDGRSIIIKLHD